RSDRPLQDLEQRLLHALARDVPRDARILRLTRDLVDLVDVDDASLAFGNVVIGRLEQAYQDVLHVLAHVTRLGQRRGVGDRERDLENASQGLGKQRLADTRRAYQQDVRLLQLDAVDHPL